MTRRLELRPGSGTAEAAEGAATDATLMREMLEHMRQGVILYEHDDEGQDIVRFFNA